MKTAVILFFLLCVQVVQAGATCLTRHLTEAIEINTRRKAAYALLTDGASKSISNKLIKMENELLWGARLGDFVAGHWRRAGVPLLCADVVEMSETPGFKARSLDRSPLSSITLRPSSIVQTIKTFVNQEQFVALEEWAHLQVLSLESEKRAYCLTRHFLESVRRAAGLVPYYQQLSQQKNLSDPTWVSKKFIKDQAELLILAYQIDQEAWLIQNKGVPIICQDVPEIPRFLK